MSSRYQSASRYSEISGAAAPGADPGYVDNGTWDTAGSDQSSWADNSGDPGWDAGGSGSDDDTF